MAGLADILAGRYGSGSRSFTIPTKEESERSVAAVQQFIDYVRQNPAESALTGVGMAGVPVVSDVAGLGADVMHYANNPEDLTLGSAALSAAGLLPGIPPAMALTFLARLPLPQRMAKEGGYEFFRNPTPSELKDAVEASENLPGHARGIKYQDGNMDVWRGDVTHFEAANSLEAAKMANPGLPVDLDLLNKKPSDRMVYDTASRTWRLSER